MDGLAPAFLRDPPMSFGRPPLGILYVEDFDAPVMAEAPAEAKIITPELTPADLDEARLQGYKAGHGEARLEQAAVRAELQTAALVAIGDALAAARADAARVAHGIGEELAATMLALLQGALPATAAAAAATEVSAVVAALLPGLRREATVRVSVHPDVIDDVGAAVHAAWPDHSARVVMCADAALAPADVRVAWSDGEARRDTGAHWSALRKTLHSYCLPELHEIVAGIGAENRANGS